MRGPKRRRGEKRRASHTRLMGIAESEQRFSSQKALREEAVLASLGIYGLISYSVARRTQEIGIRIALGARAARVQGQIVGQTLALAIIGLCIGAVASVALARGLGSLLFGVTYRDPYAFLSAAAVMFAVAALAGYLPAHRASRIDPIVALRVE